MNSPAVSVLIPVYNVEEYLGRCLESVMNQTLREIEIICVNDGSEDGSVAVLEKYAAKDSRLQIVTKENGGLPSARNAGLERARGEYVGFVDADDYVEPEMFETLVRTARKDHSEVVICGAKIFPEEPRADRWLYESLSPQYTRYDRFDASILFERGDATPFLWRVLAKRSLIEENHLRLDENIRLGEDKAFQSKLYSRAKGITLIPDKLYDYCWCRPGSMMAEQEAGKKADRVRAHVRLICGIWEDLESQEWGKEDREDLEEKFLGWSIPFIYDDFISLPLNEKVKDAVSLTDLWKTAGYWRHKRMLPRWKQDCFQYIESFSGLSVSRTEPYLSVVTVFDAASQYEGAWLKEAGELSGPDTEIIIVNNGMTDQNYVKIWEFLKENPFVRLYNTPHHLSYSESLNEGLKLSEGLYISFLEVQDWYSSGSELKSWLSAAVRKRADLCVCRFGGKRLPTDPVLDEKAEDESSAGMGENPAADTGRRDSFYEKDRSGEQGYSDCKIDSNLKIRDRFLERDFHDALYRKQFLINRGLSFADASILTGYHFYCRCLFAAERIERYEKAVYINREIHHPDWISTQKCEEVLEALEDLEDLSLEKRDASLHAEVFSLLNGDRLKKIIVNNTKPYCMPSADCPNGENSQIGSVRKVFSIISKADLELLYEAGYTDEDSILDIACDLVEERQKFLNRM